MPTTMLGPEDARGHANRQKQNDKGIRRTRPSLMQNVEGIWRTIVPAV